MSNKHKLSELNQQLKETPQKEPEIKKSTVKIKHARESLTPNPIRGERGGFLKVTITIAPDMLADLKRLGIDRKLQGKKDNDVSSLIRESLKTFLDLEKQN